jgi:hypothetical protein
MENNIPIERMSLSELKDAIRRNCETIMHEADWEFPYAAEMSAKTISGLLDEMKFRTSAKDEETGFTVRTYRNRR